MNTRILCRWAGVGGLAVVVLAAGSSVAAPAPAMESRPALGAASSRPAAPTADEIQRTVAQLRHPSPSRRQAAIRRLAAWGPLAFAELRRAAVSSDLEEALSARDLLLELESAILIGARVRLEISPARIAWDQPVKLTVHAENATPAPIRLPWPQAPASQPAEDVRQLAAMMDAADFLVVTAPDGTQIDLRVDTLEHESDLFQVVNERAGDNPPSQIVEPGASQSLVIEALNRGWARYPLLAEGRYTIRFSYQPEWKDKSWMELGFGRVESETVSVEVTRAAPELVRRRDQPLQVSAALEGGQFSATVRSTWDRPLWLNLNAGGDLATHARVVWRATSQASEDELEIGQDTEAQFRPDLVRRLDPGEAFVIHRMPLRRIREHVAQAGWSSQPVAVTFRYTYVGGNVNLAKRLKEVGRPVELPPQIFTGSLSSESLDLPPDSKPAP